MYPQAAQESPKVLSNKPPTVIQGALSQLEDAIERNMKSFSVLTNRLEPILRQEPQEPNQKQDQRPETSVPLANRLDQTTQALNILHCQIEAVRERIEL